MPSMSSDRERRFPIPAVFWHSYDHPDRRPDPDRETALAATVAAFPSWHFRTVCGACRREGHVSQVALLLDGFGERPVRDVVPRLVCNRCGGQPALVELVSRLGAQSGDGPIRRVALLR